MDLSVTLALVIMRHVQPIYTTSGIIPLVVGPMFSMNQWKCIGECSYLISSYVQERTIAYGTLVDTDKVVVVYSIYILGLGSSTMLVAR